MEKIKYCLLSGILLLSGSCMKDIDLDDLRPTPKLVLNCVVSQGAPLKASLSRTWFYTEDYPNVTIENAKVNLFVNDRPVGAMDWSVEDTEYYSIGNYVSSYHPVSGDRIRIEAEKEGFRKVMAEEVIPDKPALLNFSAESFIREPYYQSVQRRYNVTFRDNPAVVNCYLIRFDIGRPVYKYDYEDWEKPPVYMGVYNWSVDYLDYSTDPVFGNQISILDKVMGNDWLSGSQGRPFSDELINGQEYTMKLESNSYSYYPMYNKPENMLPDSVKVFLFAISEPYYKYLAALTSLHDGSLNNDLASAGLAEPVRIFSNIKGGVGILGAACVDSLTVVVPAPN